jgi:hypothetical protein
MPRSIIAIDPGTTDGAYIVWDCINEAVVDKAILPNDELLEFVKHQSYTKEIFCEMIACYGMPVGKETFETCVWIGRCEQICDDRGWSFTRVYRIPVKTHHCHSVKAKDANLRQALIDRFGQVGTKKAPGPLFGVASHMWSALAIATYAADTTAEMSTKASGS